MKIARVVVLLLLGVMLLSGIACNGGEGQAPTGAIVTFSDINLEHAIRNAIHKPRGNISQSDIDGLTSLYANSSRIRISNISGLEHCINLSYLDLSNNQISDISALSGLVNLSYLDLSENQISNISPLSGLTNLHTLNIYGNHISDINALSGLTNLSDLTLSDNPLNDISALSGLVNLSGLGVPFCLVGYTGSHHWMIPDNYVFPSPVFEC